MDEFRKSYEYDEDKKGAIFYFIIMLVSVDILLPIIFIVNIYGFLKQIPIVNIGFLGLCVLYMLFLLYTAFQCHTLKDNFVAVSKQYLIVRTIFMTVCIMILCFYNIGDKSLIGIGKQYKSTIDFVFWEVIFRMGYVLITSGGWYLYFVKSKKCKEVNGNLSMSK